MNRYINNEPNNISIQRNTPPFSQFPPLQTSSIPNSLINSQNNFSITENNMKTGLSNFPVQQTPSSTPILQKNNIHLTNINQRNNNAFINNPYGNLDSSMVQQVLMNTGGNLEPTYIQSYRTIPSNNLYSTSKPQMELNLAGEDFPELPGYKSKNNSLNKSTINQQQTIPLNSTSQFPPLGSDINESNNLSYGNKYNFSNLPSQSQPSQSHQLPPPQQSQQNSLNSQIGTNSNNISNYEQYLQKQQQINIQQKQKAITNDKFGLLGLLNVLRMTDPDLNILALGTDLTGLGLNLNSPDRLYDTFASPWAERPSRREPEYYIPMCYYMQSPLQSPLSKMSLFSDETLFYIFYSMPRDILQIAASIELFKREWRYHKDLKIWFTKNRSMNENNISKTNINSFIYFDPNLWEKVKKDNFLIPYEQFETTPPLLSTK